jgi:hypothetical protein
MQTILSDLTALTLTRAIKANWADYYAYLGSSPSADLSVGPLDDAMYRKLSLDYGIE